jgi:hypothetical protein
VISGDSQKRTLQVETDAGAYEISWDALILATGARELFLPFPGWTLPNVMGVGGLQALVKSGLPVEGKRVVVAGSGPLLLATASLLRRHKAIVPLVAEQAAWSRLFQFAGSLPPAKLLQAAGLGTMAYRADTWVARAEGQNKVEQVQLRNGRLVPCDYLAVAWGLVPNDELASHLGPDPSIFQAGECTGIGGVELSVVEGEIAGYTAAGRADLASRLFAALAFAQKFAHALNSTFAPRAELRALAEPDTIVCRCEDVSFERLQSADCRRAAKLHFRCGMGPCQGRICGPAVQFLFGWEGDSVRPPVFPARVSSLISKKETIVQ